MTILNKWDPAGEYIATTDWRVYQSEAEAIAKKIKSTSTLNAIELVLIESLISCMERNGRSVNLAAVSFIAQSISLAINKREQQERI